MPCHYNSFSRRDLFRIGAAFCTGTMLPEISFAKESLVNDLFVDAYKRQQETGSQRLSIEKLKQWEKLGYGMFIHFSMNTYDRDEFSREDKLASFYNPNKLDVDQWIGVARDAGMKYAVLT